MSSYEIFRAGQSNSFPDDHALTQQATSGAQGLVFIGADAGAAFAATSNVENRSFVALELGNECLGAHTGESRGQEGSNVVGFARFRMGKADPSNLIELVKQPQTQPDALAAAKSAFEAAGFKVAVCNDFPGRIINRLVRPYLNAALRRLDEKLASADDMDKTLCLGLGYPEGPISLLERTGLVEHFDVTADLHAALGQEAYAPARRAQVAKQRAQQPGESAALKRVA
ncbi:3-hydroxyacyl-CoA dehydrogenase [Comamonas sp. Y33R10-2]|uniref:3-hydroxyacyl-CoA dehydrogenase family protein n=1 Tax=Comamonas sp. Y33R10-2 TaxID=2853257 RepID=UPI001C5CC11F|nr:3-hydroxyacyl-CoA dehydrogenase family protein [Comamonas sp. Y33R10-2]QXZ10687.1 3-hydroxyacyl-CoA dehydrogenase [Comamonas sp. Y33R10-2]